MIVTAQSRIEAIEKSGYELGQLVDGMQVVSIKACILLPDVYEVTIELGPVKELKRLIEKKENKWQGQK